MRHDLRREPEQAFYYLFGRPYDFVRGTKQPLGTYIEEEKNWQPSPMWKKLVRVGMNPRATKADCLALIRLGDTRKLFRFLAQVHKQVFFRGRSPLRFIVEKTPGNAMHVVNIWRLFPRAKFLHLVRDPFDVLESILKTKHSTSYTDVATYVFVWKLSTILGVLLSKMRKRSYCLIFFKHLVTETEATMRLVADFLGMPYTPVLVKPTEQSGRVAWRSDTHQGIRVLPGVVDGTLYKKKSNKHLSPGQISFVAYFVVPEYQLCGFQKYREYVHVKEKRVPKEMRGVARWARVRLWAIHLLSLAVYRWMKPYGSLQVRK